MICGDANPKGNITFTYKGGCRKDLKIDEAYRCTGCGGWFHKDCILKHFELEKKHDWGREQERDQIIKKLGKMAEAGITAQQAHDNIIKSFGR